MKTLSNTLKNAFIKKHYLFLRTIGINKKEAKERAVWRFKDF